MFKKECDVNITIGGEAGYGIMSASRRISEAMVMGGLNVYTRAEYPSLIRGGHNSVSIRVSDRDKGCSKKYIDVLLALNKETIDKHKDRLAHDAAVVYDSEEIALKKGDFRKKVRLYDLSIRKLLEELELPRIVMNTMIVGGAFAVIDYDISLFEKALKIDLKKRHKIGNMVKHNVKAARAGYKYTKESYKEKFRVKIRKKRHSKRMLLTGNDALSLGAIKAGCKFLSAYPMTPASSIMTYFANHENKADVVMKQAFDEIAAINMALGASYAGVRAMTSTSGGGLALMTETISLLGMLEVPLVIVDVQRPGPATGLPTRQGQGDLKFVLNIGHGDFPRIVVAPGDHEELFRETFNAFNLAEKYQVPVLILSDKTFASGYRSLRKFRTGRMKVNRYLMSDKNAARIKDYKRFANTKTGVSKRARPGQKAIFRSSSDEHNEYGEICEEEENKVRMEDKRFRKIKSMMDDIPKPKMYGPRKADITLVGWGSPKKAILEAMDMLKDGDIKVNFLQIMYIYPFHKEYVRKILSRANKVVCVEENKTGQLADIIRMFTGREVDDKILKYGGRSFFPEDIFKRVRKIK